MAKLIGELLFVIVRLVAEVLTSSFLYQAAQKTTAWLDTEVQGRRARIVVGLFLGVSTYFLYPIIMALVS